MTGEEVSLAYEHGERGESRKWEELRLSCDSELKINERWFDLISFLKNRVIISSYDYIFFMKFEEIFYKSFESYPLFFHRFVN